MTPEQIKEYDDNCEMFGTDAWQLLMKNMVEFDQQIMDASVGNCQTNEQWQFLRGQVTQLRTIIGFEAFIRASHKEALADDDLSVDELAISTLEM